MKKTILLYLILSVLASAINYATYPIMGRILPSSEYINITVSLSLLTQITTFLSSIVAITIGLSKSDQTQNTQSRVQTLQASLFKLFLVLTIVFLCAAPWIMQYIHTPLVYAIPISIMMMVSVPLAIISGYLNGRKLMTKLGMLTLIAASFQFIGGALTARFTGNGFLSLLIMALTQVASIFFIYLLFSKDKLPKVSAALRQPSTEQTSAHMRRLLTYTLCASLAIMALNIVQIADLLIIQTLNSDDIKFYTDIYVVSRIIFFGGMIFIWPFLGEISVDNHRLNREPFIKVAGIFTVISIVAIIGLFFFGSLITKLLFGANYSVSAVQSIGTLSILYKFFFLVITAAILYFVVLRNYTAIWLSIGLCAVILIYAVLVSKETSIHDVMIAINIVAGVAAVCSTVLVFLHSTKPNRL